MKSNIDKELPPDARSQSYSDRLQEDARNKSQLAAAYAQESAGWLEKHNGALAVVSMLALSLFLLGLALTLGNRPTQLGFTALAIVMTLIAGGRIVQIAASPVDVASASCINRYGDAVTDAQSGQVSAAAKVLTAVVGDCAKFDDAWTALGQVRYEQSGKKTTERAQEAFQKALDTADAKSEDLYNNLGYIELLNKDFGPAQDNLDKAAELAPENPIVLASQAELAIAQHDVAAADRYLDKAFEMVAPLGPYFRDEFFFAGLRSDRDSFAEAGIKGSDINAFFLKGRQAEATMDLSAGGAKPGSTDGGSITNLIFKKSDMKLGKYANFVTIGFAYSGIPGRRSRVGAVLQRR